jgi:uncharacterized protein YdeI (YjbR/CyaY-like superfamily)
MRPRYFKTPADLRAWFKEHHETEGELHLGYYKKGFGKPSVTWPESVDQALCFGWIDGVRRSIDEERYVIRFTPRKGTSIWSAVNTRRATELGALGLMRPAGLRAFSLRDEKRTAIYAYERETATLPPAFARQLEASRAASRFFQAQPPGYRRIAIHWVISAKRDETREGRLRTLIEHSAADRRLPQLQSPALRKRGKK